MHLSSLFFSLINPTQEFNPLETVHEKSSSTSSHCSNIDSRPVFQVLFLIVFGNAAHPWLQSCACASKETYKQDNQVCRQLEVGGGSFSTPFIDRNQDFSFSDGSPTAGDVELWQSPAFTCKSSFSTFLVGNSSLCPASGGFSFSSCYEPSAAEFSSPVPSMPSFTFFSPSSSVAKGDISLGFTTNMSMLDASYGGKHFLFPGSFVYSRRLAVIAK